MGPIARRWEGEGLKRPPADAALARVRAGRRQSTAPEQRLWQCLRARQLNGLKFRRQVWLGPFIADFLCAEARLVVEVDGDNHAAQTTYDESRTQWLTGAGFRVVRVTNLDVMTNIDGVLAHIAAHIPSPSRS